MKHVQRWGVVLLLFALLLALGIPPGSAAWSQAKPTRYVVAFRSPALPSNAAEVIEAAGGRLVRALDQIGVAVAVSTDKNFAARLQRSSGVLAVDTERTMRLPQITAEVVAPESGPTGTDVYYDLFQWDIRRVKADQAWNIATGSHDTVVAVIDTGIAWNHPDLAPNVVYHACYSSQPTCSDYPDLHWHGTHVAGTIAAAFDEGRVVGVGPNLGLASYNVFELVDGDVLAFDSSIWAAMIDAADRGFDVINMSLGGYVIFPAQEAAIWTAWNRVVDYVNRKGVVVVASAGNDAFDLNGPVAHVPSDLSGVISVAATGIRPLPEYPQPGAYDVQAFYSNYGAAVTLSAPGGDLGPEGTPWPFPAAYYLVFSAYVDVDPTCVATASCPVGYAWAGGTSMAAPHVSGAAGLVKDLNPFLSAHQVSAILKRTAEPLGDRQIFGHGMVDVLSALQAAR